MLKPRPQRVESSGCVWSVDFVVVVVVAAVVPVSGSVFFFKVVKVWASGFRYSQWFSPSERIKIQFPRVTIDCGVL